MGVLDKFERGLERAVKAPFAKVFKAEVQPVEIASAVRGAMDERAAVLGPGRTMVPNVFTIELATTDFERLASYDTALTDELVAAAEDHADAQRYTPAGVMEVRLTNDEELETGIFRVRPASRGRKQGDRQDDPRGPQRQGPGMPSAPAPQGRPGTSPQGQQRPQGQQPSAHRPEYDPEEFRPHPRATINSRQAPAGLGGAGAVAAAAAAGAAAASGRPPQLGVGQQSPGQQAPTQQPPAQQPPRQMPPGGQQPSGNQQTNQPADPQLREFPASTGQARRPQQAVRGPQPWIEIDGTPHQLTAAVTTLGRDESADIVLDDPGASRRHAELRISHDGPHLQVVVRDLGSTNGTYLNGDQVGTEQLREGDRLTLGRSSIVFHLEGGR